jgi:hypothetical protein
MNCRKILLLTLILSSAPGAECFASAADCFLQSAKTGHASDLGNYSPLDSKQSVLSLGASFARTEFITSKLDLGPVILLDSKPVWSSLWNTGHGPVNPLRYAKCNSPEFHLGRSTGCFFYPTRSRYYSVSFVPQSHKAIHCDSMIFALGGSTTATLNTLGYDPLPIRDTLSISRDYLVYADSNVTVSQVLTASLAGILDSVRYFTEYINYDPTVLELISVTNGAITPAPEWNISTVTTVLGVIPVSATGNGSALFGPGEILRIQFHVKKATQTFRTSTVWDSGAVFEGNPLKPLLATDTGLVRVVDSCTVQMTNNPKPVSGIEQNFPNPATEKTTITYIVGATRQTDSTLGAQQSAQPVSIFLYNTVGDLVRVLVNADEDIGRHQIETDVSDLSPGTYWYELRAGSTRKLNPLVVAR